MKRPATRLGALMTLRESAEHAARSSVAELETQRRTLEAWLRARERLLTRACPVTALSGPLDPPQLDRQSRAWTQHRCAGPIAGRELAEVKARLDGARATLEIAVLRRQAVERLQSGAQSAQQASARRAAELEVAEQIAARPEDCT